MSITSEILNLVNNSVYDFIGVLSNTYKLNKEELYTIWSSNNNLHSELDEEEEFIRMINEAYEAYIKHGPTSNIKVDILHKFFSDKISFYCKDSEYNVRTECKIVSENCNNNKRCDVVLYKHDIPMAVFPVKFIMSSYKKNRNNYYENMTGELCHIKWKNPDILIVPINIILSKIPLLKTDGVIKDFEYITYENSLKIYNNLITHGLSALNISYVIDVEFNNEINEKITVQPTIGKLLPETPYIKIKDILLKTNIL